MRSDEDVELAEFALNLAKHLGDRFWTCYVGLNDEAIGTTLADLGKRIVRRALVLVVMNCDLDASLRQFQRDSSSDAARTPGDQCVFSIDCHIKLPGLRDLITSR